MLKCVNLPLVEIALAQEVPIFRWMFEHIVALRCEWLSRPMERQLKKPFAPKGLAAKGLSVSLCQWFLIMSNYKTSVEPTTFSPN